MEALATTTRNSIHGMEASGQWRAIRIAGCFELRATALNDFAYNFVKIHRTLRMSPAMAAASRIGSGAWKVWQPSGKPARSRGQKERRNHEHLASIYFHWKRGHAVWNIEHASQCRSCDECPAKAVDNASHSFPGCPGFVSLYHFGAPIRPSLGLRHCGNGRRLLVEI